MLRVSEISTSSLSFTSPKGYPAGTVCYIEEGVASSPARAKKKRSLMGQSMVNLERGYVRLAQSRRALQAF
jgi:hypothetical protein